MLTIISAKNPVWGDENKTFINLQVQFAEFANEILPFTAHPDDSMSYSVELFNNAKNGLYGEIANFVPAPMPADPKNPPADQPISTGTMTITPSTSV